MDEDNLAGRKLAARVADQIELHRDRYDQTLWWDSDDRAMPTVRVVRLDTTCHTVGCVAGWSVHEATEEELAAAKVAMVSEVETAGQRLLGLSNKEADWLFSPCRAEDAMPQVLREYAATGYLPVDDDGDVAAYFGLHSQTSAVDE